MNNAKNKDSDNDLSDLNTSFDDNEYFHMNMARINHTLSKMDLENKIKNIRTQFITFASNVKQWDKTFGKEIEQIRHEVKSLNLQIGNEKQSKMANDVHNTNQCITSKGKSIYLNRINNLDHKNLTHASRTPDLDKDNTNFTQKEHNMLF